jgi:hypothetical protein
MNPNSVQFMNLARFERMGLIQFSCENLGSWKIWFLELGRGQDLDLTSW